jgi:hypothetical protein
VEGKEIWFFSLHQGGNHLYHSRVVFDRHLGGVTGLRYKPLLG